jgi:hypothetical protein
LCEGNEASFGEYYGNIYLFVSKMKSSKLNNIIQAETLVNPGYFNYGRYFYYITTRMGFGMASRFSGAEKNSRI